MKRRFCTGFRTVALALAGGMLFVPFAGAAPSSEEAGTELDIAKSVRAALAALPGYDIFDLLTYQMSQTGVVTLGGYVLQASLKDDAERAVRKIQGVKDVENKIDPLLPASSRDKEVRGAAYRAIYSEPRLSRYADDDLAASRPRLRPWGRGFHRWVAFGEPRWSGRPFLGMEPVGNYAIHIIVANGDITLVGVVDNQADKDLAGTKAKGVAGAFKVTNDLQVETEPKDK